MTKKKRQAKSQTQLELLMEFFKENPNRDIPHPEIIDWATKIWKKRTSRVFKDPSRGVRKLHQQGYLVKVKKGVYHYNPNKVEKNTIRDFTSAQKRKIFERDNYRCVVCGRGRREGMELHASHIKPQELGGQATIDNGQTLCSQHNMMRNPLKQTETWKKVFTQLYETAKKEKNKKIREFSSDILKVYEDHDINEHIEWK